MQCNWCGIWRRRMVEKREDGPPEEELNIGVRTDRRIAQLNRTLRAGRAPPSGILEKRNDPCAMKLTAFLADTSYWIPGAK